MSEQKLAQTYVWHGGKFGKRFFVSTINRKSSAVEAYGAMYAETMAWEWPEGAQARGPLVFQGECGAGSLLIHSWVVQELLKTGKAPRQGED